MGTRTAVGTAVLAAVFTILALRPVFSNPATTTLFDGGLSRFDLLVGLSLVVPAVVLFALRLLAYTRDSEDQSDWQRPEQSKREPSPPESRQMVTDRRDTDERDGDGNPDNGDSDDSNTDATAILGGQGGARDTDFEIEDEPPDASLADHFEYLEDRLDETEERPAVEELDPETLDESPIPDRCPQEYCDAIWTERTVLGFGGERYEVVEDGQVRCLECEQVYHLSE